MDDLDALLQGALDDFEPVTAAPACAPEEATIQTLAVGLRALLGDIGAKDFRPRMEALVQQAEGLAQASVGDAAGAPPRCVVACPVAT